MRIVIAVVGGLALTGCTMIAGASPSSGDFQSTSLVPAVTIAAYKARAKITEWRLGADKDCSAASMSTASDEVARIRGYTSGTYANGQNPQSVGIVQDMYADRAMQMSQLHIPVQLDLADAYLEGECLDQADRLYRQIITTYVGASFEGYRQRAQNGVDDVRSKRGSQ